jgi:hypothetical protein
LALTHRHIRHPHPSTFIGPDSRYPQQESVYSIIREGNNRRYSPKSSKSSFSSAGTRTTPSVTHTIATHAKWNKLTPQCRIAVFWKDDGQFYAWLDMSMEKFQFIDDEYLNDDDDDDDDDEEEQQGKLKNKNRNKTSSKHEDSNSNKRRRLTIHVQSFIRGM